MILTTGLAYGGAEMQLVKLAINLKKEGMKYLLSQCCNQRNLLKNWPKIILTL